MERLLRFIWMVAVVTIFFVIIYVPLAQLRSQNLKQKQDYTQTSGRVGKYTFHSGVKTLAVFVEPVPNKDIRVYKTDRRLSDSSVTFSRPLLNNGELAKLGLEENQLVLTLLELQGVTEITLDQDELSVMKSPAFTWDERQPEILRILKGALLTGEIITPKPAPTEVVIRTEKHINRQMRTFHVNRLLSKEIYFDFPLPLNEERALEGFDGEDEIAESFARQLSLKHDFDQGTLSVWPYEIIVTLKEKQKWSPSLETTVRDIIRRSLRDSRPMPPLHDDEPPEPEDPQDTNRQTSMLTI